MNQPVKLRALAVLLLFAAVLLNVFGAPGRRRPSAPSG
jgi:hypothetical protein